MPRKTDKRIRLIEAAKVLIHQQGFNLTTLADIAQEAEVPLGNVYYYFKTKLQIGESVCYRLSAENAEVRSRLDEISDPLARLCAFVEIKAEELEQTARYGSAIGSLCGELGKHGGPLADQAAKIIHDILQWVEAQFRALGFSDKAEEYALTLVSTMQGSYLLTHTFKDPKIASNQANSLISWLEGLTGTKVSRAVEEEAAVY